MRDMARHLDLCERKIDELTAQLAVQLEHRRKKPDSATTTPTEYPDLGDDDLLMLMTRILFEHGKASVGKLGSLLHSYTNNHGLSAMCKEKYGGLKKFLELHPDVFIIGPDHPFNRMNSS